MTIVNQGETKMTKLTPEQVAKLINDPQIKATLQANKTRAQLKRESDLMLLGYNQAILDYGKLPAGHTVQSWNDVIEGQKAKLGKG